MPSAVPSTPAKAFPDMRIRRCLAALRAFYKNSGQENPVMKSDFWLIRQPGGSRRLRLYCFCYAGGNAIHFMPWQSTLDPEIEVCAIQLPGRGMRLGEKPYTSLPALVESLAQVIAGQPKIPFVFFGHSLGGLLAFELARYCKRHHLPVPERLFVSGCDAPQHRRPSRNLHRLSDDALIDALRKYNGTPSELLENRELMNLVLPTTRADFSLVENYKYVPMPLLDIPITVLAGRKDDYVRQEQTEGWREETTATCRIRWFEGDHFFINQEQQAVLDCLRDELSAL